MLNQFALALARPLGFLLTISTVLIGIVLGLWLGWPEGWLLAFNLYLSTLAIVIGGIMLIAQAEAVQAKLDELIGASRNARNDLIRAEEKSHAELEDLRKQQSS